MNELEHIEAAIAALESQRAALGDAVVNAGVAPLREKLVALRAQHAASNQQIKYVTVLFADVVGSVELGRRLDPEDTHAIMDGALRRFAAIVERFDGRVLRFMGDGLSAVFGADITREDDAERAVHAGLAMLADAREYAAEIAKRHSIDGFTIRVGLNTGHVVLGGGVEADNTVMGSTVNLAARMEQHAPPGGLRISHDTYRHVRGVFDVSEEPPLAVKGYDTPLRTYLVDNAKPRALRISSRGIEGIETRMVGRDVELATLEKLYQEVIDTQHLRMATVIADAGMGKSRLLTEFESWTELRPERIWLFHGRAHPQSMGQPYGVLRDLVAWRFQIKDSDSLEYARDKFVRSVAAVVREDGETHAHLIGHLIGLDFSASPHIAGIINDAKQIRDRAFHAVATFFRALAKRGDPINILLDDLHWADDGSLDMVDHLIAECHDVPVMIVCLARPTLLERRPGWGQAVDTHNVIELSPLGRRSSRELAGVLLQRVENPPSVLKELITRGAEGNPFYMEELVKMLIDDGAIVPGPERWQVVPERLLAAKVPATLTGVLQARLDALPLQEKLTLQQAAVVGFVFWDEAVKTLLPPEPATLGSLAARELIFAREPSGFEGACEYVFKHHVLHQVVYESLLKRVRREAHAKIANWLASRSGERQSEYLGTIADHYLQAGDTANAALYLRRAGDDAAARYASDMAIDYLSRALELTPESSLADRFALLQAREPVLELKGQSAAQLADIEAMETIAHQLDDNAFRALAAERRGNFAYRKGDFAGAIEAAQRAEQLAIAAHMPAVALRVQAWWGAAERAQGEYERAQARGEAMLAQARAMNDRRTEAEAMRLLGVIVSERGELAAARDYFEQSLHICQALGDKRRETMALNNLGDSAMRQGDYIAARAFCEGSLRLAREVGFREGESSALTNLGLITHHLDENDAAVTYSRQALTILRAIGDRDFEGFALNNLGNAYAALGKFPEATKAYQSAVSLLRELGLENRAAEPLAGLARAALAQGSTFNALAYVEEILTHLEGGGNVAGTDEPLRIYLTCYHVLSAAHDARAAALLRVARSELDTMASRIASDNVRRMFIENIRHHRELMTLSQTQPLAAA